MRSIIVLLMYPLLYGFVPADPPAFISSEFNGNHAVNQGNAEFSTVQHQRELLFEINDGQQPLAEKFVAQSSSYRIGFSEAYFLIEYRGKNAQLEQQKITFLGGNPEVEIVLQKPSDAKINYYNGQDSSDWFRNVKSFEQLIYIGLYDGIDVVFYGDDHGRVEFDFVLSEGADPNQIRLSIPETELYLDSTSGKVQLNTWLALDKLAIYQKSGSSSIEIPGSYKLKSIGELAFDVSEYNHDSILIIDPVVIYSTYLGGSEGSETVADIAVDDQGNVYLLGQSDFSLQWYISKLIPGKLDFEFINWFGSTDGSEVPHQCISA
ncbi:MAG: SBBP repeat-containing protein [Saprospiraceae bacterium]|nr:SBBP repeat-containing protein [Saprospiraceae bacterium]